MTIYKFIKICEKEDTPIGDIARDILEDKISTKGKSAQELFDYLNQIIYDPDARYALKRFIRCFNSFNKKKVKPKVAFDKHFARYL